MAQVKCQYFDFELTKFYEPEVCEAVSKNPCCVTTKLRNIKYKGTPSEPDGTLLDQKEPHFRFITNVLSRIHLLYEEVSFCEEAVLPVITRILACQEGCDTDYNAVAEPWRGTGMMVPPGEYMISIPVGVAYGEDPCGFSGDPEFAGHITVVVEPVTQDHVWAMMFNQAKC